MKPYSNDLRQKVIEVYRQGKSSLREIAERFLVSLSFVWLLVKQFRETGRIDPKPHGGGKKSKIAGADLFVLRQLVEEHSDATLLELSNLFFERTGIKVSESTVWQALQRLRISRKKKTFHATERDTDEKVRQARKEYRRQQPTMPARKLIFVDESGTNLGMARTYGRAPIGQRVLGAKPQNRGPNISLVGALGIKGVTAAMLVKGAINGEVFKAFVEQVLAPTLQPGDRVLMDNLNVHKVAGIEEIIQSKQAKLCYLPSYSPDFSPIECCWSKVKEYLRSTAARTFDDLQEGIKNALDKVTETDAEGWFKHCGYCIEPG
jgi:transposase